MRQHPKRKKSHILIWIVLVEILIAACGLGAILIWNSRKPQKDPILETELVFEFITEEPETEAEEEEVFYVPKPEISEQLLTINEWSRPGKKIEALNYIVIHYLGNPGTTAQENHDYFESLKDLQDVSMSANYVVGMDGEIIHCVPDDEVAYASNSANSYSISVENCHPDESGRFTQATYDSLVELVAYLSEQYGIERTRIIRHHDITGKDCPKFFVEHESAWKKFLDDVMDYRESCRTQQAQPTQKKTVVAEDHELSDFLAKNNEEQ